MSLYGHVPMIINSPNQANKGKQTFEITELIDMFPSLCELAGIDAPPYMQGKSFVPLINDPERSWKTAAFSQFHRRPKISPDGKRYMGYSIRTKEFHYVMWHYWDAEKGERGEFVIDELYNSIVDPEENENIAEIPEMHTTVEELRKQLQAGWRAAQPKIN